VTFNHGVVGSSPTALTMSFQPLSSYFSPTDGRSHTFVHTLSTHGGVSIYRTSLVDFRPPEPTALLGIGPTGRRRMAPARAAPSLPRPSGLPGRSRFLGTNFGLQNCKAGRRFLQLGEFGPRGPLVIDPARPAGRCPSAGPSAAAQGADQIAGRDAGHASCSVSRCPPRCAPRLHETRGRVQMRTASLPRY
jgi:hypothetical protein